MAAGWPCRGRRSLLGPGSLVSLGRVGSSACRTESFQAECLLWQATPCLWGKESVSWAGHPWWQDPAAGLSWCNTLVGEVSQARRQCFWAGCFVEAGSTGCFAVFDEVDLWVLRVGLCQLSFPGPLYVE